MTIQRRKLEPLTTEQSALVAQWYRYAVWCASKFAGPYKRRWGLDYEDFQDRAIDGLIVAAKSYNPDRPNACPWFQFMALCIRVYLRKKDRKKRVNIIYRPEINEFTAIPGGQDDIDERDRLQMIFNRFSRRRKIILDMLINNHANNVEIANTVGVTPQAVSKVECEITAKLMQIQ